MIQPSEIVKLTFTVVLAWQLVWLQENRTLRKVQTCCSWVRI